MEKQQRRKGRGSLQGAPPAGRVFQIRNTDRTHPAAPHARLARQRKPLPVRADDRFLHRPRPAGGLAKRWLGIRFEVLEVLTQKETQTEAEFKSDIEALFELWQEKLADAPQY